MSPAVCVRDLRHEFDVVSGWCLHGCGWREDGQSAHQNPHPRHASNEDIDITEPRHPNLKETP